MSLPRYPSYKDSGVEWLGQVPEHWSKTALKFLGEYQNGFPFKPEDWGTEGLPIIRIAQLTGVNEPNFYAGKLDKRVQVGTGDLLFSWSATIDSFIWDRGSAWLNQHIFKVTPSVEAEKKYLFYVIKHVAPKLADFDAHGSTMRHIKKESLGERVVVPPRVEQAAIAEFLDRETGKIDELVAEQRRLMELLKEKRQAVISHAVTRGLNPNAPLKPSGIEWLGDVPAHWKMVRLRALFRQQKRQDQVGKPVLSVYRDYGVILKDSRDDNMNKTPEDLSAYQLVNPSDLVVNKMKAWQGSLGVSDLEGITSPDYVVFSPRHRECSAFLHLLLRSQRMVSIYRSISNGIRPAQWRLEPDTFLSLPVFLPPDQEQRDLVFFVTDQTSRFDALTSEAQRAIDLLQERRTALISAAVTGQIDVRDTMAKAHGLGAALDLRVARAVLAAEILTLCNPIRPVHRVKLQKLIHLSEHEGELEEIGGDYERQAHGPYDEELMNDVAVELRSRRWFEEKKVEDRFIYIPLEKAGEHVAYLQHWGDKFTKVTRILGLLNSFQTARCERYSTLYAAWNDLLIKGRSPSDAEIIHEASDPTSWHESKSDFTQESWAEALQWMKANDVVPKGFGMHTRRFRAPRRTVDRTGTQLKLL